VAVEAALAKARAFDPAAYGAMAPMAELARDAAMKQLEQLRANLPAPVIVTDLAAPGADSTVTVDIEADDTGVVIGKAVVSTEALEQLAKPVQLAQAYFGAGGGRVIPKATRPADLAMAELVALQYDVSNETAIGWLATFDADGARAALAGS